MGGGLLRLASIGAAAVLVAGLAGAGAAEAGTTSGRPAAAGLTWLQAALRDHGLSTGLRPDLTGRGGGLLEGIAAGSAADAWAVGLACRHGCGAGGDSALVEHWNGASWTRVPSPSAGLNNALEGVTVVSATDAWAVGASQRRGNAAVSTLIEHWNGATWSRVPSPSPDHTASSLNVLRSVTAAGADDAWAGGVACGTSACRDLLLHWNGVRWSRAPFAPVNQEITGLAAVSAGNAWATGQESPAARQRAVIDHWNGTRWSPQPTSSAWGTLDGVAALSRRDVWAVGSQCGTGCRRNERALVLHWNGVRWASVPVPAPGIYSELLAVTSPTRRDAWAVGLYHTRSGSNPLLFEHWNGTRWSRLYGPRTSGDLFQMDGISAVSSGQAWAAGISCTRTCAGRSLPYRPALAAWNGRHWLVAG
jgi:hypothetical protein